ncbi:hypothetical protein IQ250_25360 [Pseudanabaenaceae cyanobacterium LEGE 13415]|nr:hypothetical protein [Pseudanabaenaceae cyanobacterium LEGE 13415]
MSARWVQQAEIIETKMIPTIEPTTTIATGMTAILLPTIFVVGIVARRKYRQHTMNQRIRQLERSWRLSPYQNTR